MIALGKSAVVGLTVAALGAGLLAAAGPAMAAPAPSPAYTARLGSPGASAFAVADNQVFVSVGNGIYVSDLTGRAVTTISTTGNVTSLLASPDGSEVFAAGSNGGSIWVVDTSTLSVKASWPAGGCISSMAITAGRLFFGYGCSSPFGIASVDAATGGSQVASGTTDNFNQAPMIAAANGQLVAGDGVVYSYTVSGAVLTKVAKSTFSVERQLAISPDGSQVAATEMAPYQVVQFDTATMTEDETYSTGAYPNAVAYNGDGSRLAAGLNPSGNSSVQLYDTATGSELSSIGPLSSGGNVRMGLAGMVSFGPDLSGKPDALVYSVAFDYSANAPYLQVASVTPLSIAHMTLSLSSPKAWGQPLVASVNFPGHPNTALTLKVLPNSGSPIYVPVRTNQWGVLIAKVGVNFTGRIYAYYGGDLLTRHEAPSASAIQSYTVPTRTTASVLGAYRSSGGVLFFRTAASVHLHIAVAPPHVRTVAVTLQAYLGGKWVTRQATSFTSNQWGTIDLVLSSTSRNVRLRTIVVMPSTVFNTGSSAVTPTFEVG